MEQAKDFNHNCHPQSAPQIGTKWWKRPAFVIFILFCLGFGLFMLLGIAAFAGLIIRSDGFSNHKNLTEERIEGTGKQKIARINLSGTIVERAQTPFSYGVINADSIIEELKAAGSDRDVAAVLLRVDSPGGGVTASDRIHREVVKLKKKKKVAVIMGDTAASGGYYISVAANRIFAHPTTMTGSIGVIATSLNVHDLLKQFGVQSVVIKSSEYKDLLSPFKPVEELSKDKAVLQKIVMALYERFIKLVSEGRALSLERVKELADGKVYDSQTALEYRLIDAIGYEDDAVSWLKDQIGKKDVTLIEYIRPEGLFSRILLESLGVPAETMGVNTTAPWWHLLSRPAYLWLPGL